MAFVIRKAVRLLVPVVAIDIQIVLRALAAELPARAGQDFLSQIDFVARKPDVLARGFEYSARPDAPRLAALKGVHELGVVEMAYYQQAMPFVVSVRDGFLYRVETREPQPIETPPKHLTVLRVSINQEVLGALEKTYRGTP